MPDEPRTIIVAAGRGRRSDDALAAGIALAALRDARLLLVSVVAAPGGSGALPYLRALRENAAQALEELRREVPAGVDAETRVVGSTSVVRGLHSVAEEEQAEILVVGPAKSVEHGHGELKVGAIHAAPCAVAVVPAGYAEDGEPRRLTRLAAAYDGSPESEQALRAAADLARSAGGRLHIVSALDRPYVYADPPVVDAEGHRSYLRSRAGEVRQALEDARRTMPEDLAVTTEFDEGTAVEALARVTEAVDLLVMGSRGYGPLRRALLGSVAAGVVERARCPVLVLPRGAPAGDAGREPAAAGLRDSRTG